MRWWQSVVAMEIRKIIAFRADFWVTIVGQVFIQLFIARALWESIFFASGKEVMEGFTLESMTLYYLIVPLGSRMLTGENMGFLSREIYEGTFSRYLIYPLSFFDYKTLTYLTYSAFYACQLSLAFIGYHLIQGDLMISHFGILSLGLLFFMLSAFVYCNLSLFIELIAVWADNIWSLMVMLRFLALFFGGAFVPLAFFPKILQNALYYSPFPYLITLPMNILMNKAQTSEMILGFFILIIWALFIRFLAKKLWQRGQLSYTGVGM